MKYNAKYIFIEGEFKKNITIDVKNNIFFSVEENAKGEGIVDLGNVALLPGCVNAHSHAFQRAIRGRTESRDLDHPHDDFWSWRKAMYRAANTLSADDITTLAEFTFLEMAQVGITSVGEFHYLHHQEDGSPYADQNELAHRMIAAAHKIGIRISLLNVAYHFGGIDEAARPSQCRFVSQDLESYFERVRALRSTWKGDNVVIGYAPHSVRAVDEEWLIAIAQQAQVDASPLHIHASEQRAEVEDALKKRGRSPIQWIHDQGALGSNTTIIHANHATEKEIALMAQSGASICACPTTERNLGDGFLPMSAFLRADIPICVGSDSHTQIDLFSELRLLEYNERLQKEERNVLAQVRGEEHTWAALFPMLSCNGSRALGLGAASISEGQVADFITLDLEHRTLLGSDWGALANNVLLTMTPDAIRDVFVGGKKIIDNGRHVYQSEVYEKVEGLMDKLWKKS